MGANTKGGDMSEWPESLRVREFPEARCCFGKRGTAMTAQEKGLGVLVTHASHMQEFEALRADSARLDWLENNSGKQLTFGDSFTGEWVCSGGKGATVRAAIDAAMKGTQ